ncbi:hypothetical protein pb186bvf_020332 [Paramecium bursaria]
MQSRPKQPVQFLQTIHQNTRIEQIVKEQYKDNSNKTSSNEELFNEISRLTQNQTSSSGGSGEPTRSKTVDKHNRNIERAINRFNAPKVLLLEDKDNEQVEGGEFYDEIHKVFSKEKLTTQIQGSPDHVQQYGSVLSTEISEKPDLNKNPSKQSLGSGSEQYLKQQQQQQYYYPPPPPEEDSSTYENNQRRKRKTIADEDSHLYQIKLDKNDQRTTIMIKNIPNKYTIQLLIDLIDKNYKSSYDFLYLPIDFKNRCNMGYAFINFVETKVLERFHYDFQGKKWPHFNSEKICQLRYARIQGRQALIQHFQFSSVMNQKVIFIFFILKGQKTKTCYCSLIRVKQDLVAHQKSKEIMNLEDNFGVQDSILMFLLFFKKQKHI